MTLREQIAEYVQHKHDCDSEIAWRGRQFGDFDSPMRPCSCGLSTLLASLDPRQDETGWRDISTAPKDGTVVLGWFDCHSTVAEGGAPFVMRWNDDKHAATPRPFFEASGWVWGVRDNRKRQPIAWMPLPAAPTPERQEP